MKPLLTFATLALSVLTLSSAHAATACDTHLACGSYEGNGALKDNGANVVQSFQERLTISSTSENEALMVITVTGKQPKPEVYNLVIKFQDDGSFTMTQHDHLYAAGICKNEVCTYGMSPFQWPGYEASVANAGFLRFTKDGVERSMLVSAPDGLFTQVSTLVRK